VPRIHHKRGHRAGFYHLAVEFVERTFLDPGTPQGDRALTQR
jgi:hypothetical protein